ncbi:MAG: glycine oxidase ThiO [Blastocatellia bacterium]|nr:glycine oxidase ThiO [Blastocatellia bacterium]
MYSDIIVIGGGLIGCGIAAQQASSGLKVNLFERGELIKEASWAAAGMLAPQSELTAITPLFLLCQKSLAIYPEFTKKLYEQTRLDPCHRSEGSLQLAFDQLSAQELEKKLNWQASAGLNLRKLTSNEVKEFIPSISSKVLTGYYLPDEHQVDNRKLSESIVKQAQIAGVNFHLGSQVTEIIVEQNKAVGIIANGERHLASKIINAAGSWASLFSLPNFPKHILPEIKPVRGQMLAVKASPKTLSYTLHSKHIYLVPRFDGTIIIGSTTEHVGYDKSVTINGLENLSTEAKTIIPELANASLVSAWAGLRPASIDLLPILGEHSQLPGFVFATGHYRNGILLAPITIELISKLIFTGKTDELLLPFSPNRFISTAKAS